MPDGPGRFTQNSSCSALLRMPLRFVSLHVRDSHPLRSDFPDGSIHDTACDDAVLQPRGCRNSRGLGFSPFARHYWGNHVCFLFLRVLRCFSSPRWPPNVIGCHPFRMTGCPIRKSADQRSFAPPRGLSQLITSFVASESQGIRHAPFLTFRSNLHTPCGVRDEIYFQLLTLKLLLLVTSCHRPFLMKNEER